MLEQVLGHVRTILDSHNDAAPDDAKVDIDKFFERLRHLGATTPESLKEATWEDLRDAGIPLILARRVAKYLRSIQSEPKPTRVTPSSVNTMSVEELLRAYDPDDNNLVSKRLSEIVGDAACIVFDSNGKVDITASAAEISEFKKFGARDTEIVFIDNKPLWLYKIGSAPAKLAEEHPMRPGTILRNGKSNRGCDWGKVALKTKQIIYIAATVTNELGDADEIDLHEEAMSKPEKIIQRFPAAAMKLLLPGYVEPTLMIPINGTKPEIKKDPFAINKRY